jgi:hypothetical protein
MRKINTLGKMCWDGSLRHPDRGYGSYVICTPGRLQLWQDAPSETSVGPGAE